MATIGAILASNRKKKEKAQRTENANELLQIIASCGRKFFRRGDRVSQFQIDDRGRIWFVDCYKGTRIYTHYKYDWRGFSEGGTLHQVCKRLRDYIAHGTQLPPKAFGPWDYDGDPWGYGDDMAIVRDAAVRLGIVAR